MKIISGGQTGVDSAALEFALQNSLRHGGWVPKGRLNENGRIPAQFKGLVEALTPEPNERTRLNAGSSDATLIITDRSQSPGTTYTSEVAKELGKPVLCIDLSQNGEKLRERLWHWLTSTDPVVLNIAGPRESEAPGIQSKALTFLNTTLLPFLNSAS